MTDPANQTQPPTDKLVPEKDLLAVKSKVEGLEQQLKEAQAALASKESEWKKQLDAATNKLYTSEASVKKLEEQLKESAGAANELAGVKTKLADLEKQHTETSTKLLDAKRKTLVSQYKVAEAVVKDKDLAALDLFEEALKAVGGVAGNNYAGSPPAGGTPTSPPKARETIKAGFDKLHPADK